MAEIGRPPIVTLEVLQKLEYAFSMGCTDLEACMYADIGKSTLYNFQKEHPEFLERKELLKENPVMLARMTVVKSLKTNPQIALSFLDRKKKSEFSTRVENTGADGKDLIPQPILGAINVPMNVPANNRNEENSPAIETDTSGTGRDISEQDNFDRAPADTGSSDGQEPDTN